MSEYAWTAAEVYELVKGWPEEARPRSCYFVKPVDARFDATWNSSDDSAAYDPAWDIAWVHAAALHVASGLEWLCCNAYAPLMRMVAGRFELKARGTHTGDTPLHAISAAIMEASK